jgi:Metal binding domain of Ada
MKGQTAVRDRRRSAHAEGSDMTARRYTLLGPDGQPYQSATSGALGGYQPGRVYGRLDCPAALRAIARGQYVRNRVFFVDEQTAVAAGYRPCAVCLPDESARWKAGGGSRCSGPPAFEASDRCPPRR